MNTKLASLTLVLVGIGCGTESHSPNPGDTDLEIRVISETFMTAAEEQVLLSRAELVEEGDALPTCPAPASWCADGDLGQCCGMGPGSTVCYHCGALAPQSPPAPRRVQFEVVGRDGLVRREFNVRLALRPALSPGVTPQSQLAARPRLVPPTALAPQCIVDSDCRLVTSTCGGCSCSASTAGAAEPLCQSEPVACLRNACDDQTAVCRAGRCAMAPPPS